MCVEGRQIGAEHFLKTIRLHLQLGFEISPDPFPDENDFIRSDQFPFVRAGVPALYVTPGMKSTDPKVDGKAIYMNWLEHIYHTPHDEITLPFDWASNRLRRSSWRA